MSTVNTVTTDILIIGSGPAGLSAAIAAKKQGAGRVYVIERLPYPGGLLHQCIHSGFGARHYGMELTGPKYAERLINEADNAGVITLTSTFATHITREPFHEKSIPFLTVHTLSSRKTGEATGLCVFKPKAIILATGCRERTIGQLGAAVLNEDYGRGINSESLPPYSPLITGARPSGIFTAGTAQHMINIGGYHMGKRAVILGSGDIGLIVARRLTITGTLVACIVEQSDSVGGMAKNKRNSIDAYNIPFLPGHTVTKIHGKSRLEGVTITKLSPNGTAVIGSERTIPCDTLILSVGLIPETDLLIDFASGSKVAGIPQNLLICGNAGVICRMADDIADDGTRAGLEAAAICTE